MQTYLQITQAEEKNMLQTKNLTRAQLVPLPNMVSTVTKQYKTASDLTNEQLCQWVTIVTMEIYNQDQQEK